MMSLQSPFRTFRSPLRIPLTPGISQISLRYASLNSAIGRGIRRSQRLRDPRILSEDNLDRSQAERKPFDTRRQQKERSQQEDREDRTGASDPVFDDDKFSRRGSFRALPQQHQRSQHPQKSHFKYGSPSHKGRASRYDIPLRPLTDRQKRRLEWKAKHDSEQLPMTNIDEDEFIRTGNLRAIPHENKQRLNQSDQKPRANREFPAMDGRRPPPQVSTAASRKASENCSERPQRLKQHVKIPDTIPYTTPASEFIWGTTAVEAALRCGKRQLYKLYLYRTGEEGLGLSKSVLQKLALAKDVQVKIVVAGWIRLLDKMTSGRPHNGCVLEASPLPQTPVEALKPFKKEQGHFCLELAPQTREEAEVNGTNDQVPINLSTVQHQPRYPVVLLLDGIVDPGNLGAIIRSAYFLGVDAVIFAGRNSAPLSAVALKAAAGAAENMPLLNVKNEVDFIERSKVSGWRFYAADTPDPRTTYIDPCTLHTRNPTTEGMGNNAENLIGHSPSVIMMGNEASGLSRHIKSRANSVVSIPGARIVPGAMPDVARVDSLNVSVAAALLMDAFLRVPLGLSRVARKGEVS
ncbi:hypothetical protein BDV12DRAFT_161071 [Aspergillus spectabilis]